MSAKTLCIRVYGRVQGVWFRASTKNKADQLGLAGNVRNMPDGSVYIEVTGNEQEVHAFLEWCSQGPELARVDNVEVENMEPFTSDVFKVIR